jgi:microcystin-dependent protein
VDLDGEPYLGEVRTFAFPFAPLGWASCDGQILREDQHAGLFLVIRNRYGGDGETTFGLPDMRATPAKGAAAPGQTIGTLVRNYCIATSGRFPGRG